MSLLDGVIQKAYYDWGGRKYLDLVLTGGVVRRVKVPYRYGRVMCKVDGIRPIQELNCGEEVRVVIDKKVWSGDIHWVLVTITPKGDGGE